MSDTPSGNSPILSTGIDTSGFLKGFREMTEASQKFVTRLDALSTLASKTGVKTGQQIGEGIRNAIVEYTRDTSKILSAMTNNTQAAQQAGQKIGRAIGRGLEDAALAETADIASRITASIRTRVGGVTISEQFRGKNAAALLQTARARRQQLTSDVGADDFSDDELRAADAAMKALDARRKAEVAGITAARTMQKQKADDELAQFDRALAEIERKRKAEAAGITANQSLKRRQEAAELAAFDRALAEIDKKRRAEAVSITANQSLKRQQEAAELAAFDQALAEIQNNRRAEAAGIEQVRKLQKQKADEAIKQINREMEQRVKLRELEVRSQQDAIKSRAGTNVAQAYFTDPTTSPRSQLRIARRAQAELAAGSNRADVEAKYGSAALDANVDKLRKLVAAQSNSSGMMKQWTANAREAHSMARGLAGSLGVLWLTWGSTIPIAAGAALGMSMRSVLNTGKELEYQLKFVSELTDRSAVSFDAFFGAMGSTMTAPLEAAKGMRALAQSGLDTKQALAALKPTLDLAVVGELSVAEAAFAATGAMHAFNLGFTEISRVGDVFAKAAAISNTSVAGITESMKQASTVAEFYGITVEQTGAALALLAKRNIEGSAAGTAFRNMMVELTTPSEKAKKAMAQLGLELYDNQNRLKGFEEIMKELYGTISQLDEKSRLAALNDIFNERGVKAAAAILGDYTTFESLLREMGEAGGYTSQVLSGLSDTVQGQLQIAFANLQKTFAKTFEEVQFGTRNIARDLAELAQSEGLREVITFFARSTIDFTRALIDNKEAVGFVIAAWAGLKMAGALGLGLLSMAQALKSAGMAARMAGTSFSFAAVAAGNLWRMLTGPLGLILGLAGAYLTLRQNVDEGNEAVRANGERMRDLIMQTKDAADAQFELNQQLIERNRLLAEGRSPDQIAPSDVRKAAAEFNKIATERNKLKEAYDADRNDVNKQQNYLKAQAEFDRQKVVFEELLAQTDRAKRESLIGREESELEKDLKIAKEINRQIEIRGEKSSKGFPARLDEQSLRSMTEEARKKEIERTRAALSTNTYTPSTRSRGDREGQRLLAAQQRGATDEFNDAVRRQDMLYERELFSIDKQFQYREITEAQYNEKRLLASQEYLRQLDALEQESLYKLGGLKDAADKKSQQEQLKNAADRVRKANEERQLRESLEKGKRTEEAKYAFNEDMRAIDRRLPGLEGRALKDSRDKLANKDIGLMSPEEAAALEAATAATKTYSDVLADLSRKKEEAIDRFGIESAQVEEATRLEGELKDEMARVAQQAGENGRALAAYYRTTEYGAKQAFNAYVTEASNAAAATERLLTNAFKGAEDALVNFVKTGKLDFRSLAESIISDLIRIRAQQDMVSIFNAIGGSSGAGNLIGAGLSFLTGGASEWAGIGLGSGGGAGWNPMDLRGGMSWNANGNVFGPSGKIDAFAAGDIFSKTTLFRHSGNRLGALGEAGTEAIMPVDRDSNGRLGVKVVGAHMPSVAPQQQAASPAQAPTNIRVVNAFDTSVIGDYIGSAEGEKTILNVVKNNAGFMRQLVRS